MQKKECMEDNIIKYIDMETLKSYNGQETYTDDYLFVTDKLEKIFLENKNVKLEVFLMIYCTEGEIKLELNNVPHYLHQDDLIISLPNTLIGRVSASSSHKVKVICFSNRFLQRLTQTEKYTWKWICYIRENPVKHFEKREEKELFNQYLKLIESKAKTDINKCQKDILLHIASAFFGEMIFQTTQKSIESETDIHTGSLKQSDFLFKQFMEALSADNGKHRTLDYYANLFCYSPKYLSRIIKQISGKNALSLIHENAIEHIILELKYSNKSMKEIAMDFDFSNTSFFAQYVKKHLGMTPSEYRSYNQATD